MRVRVRDRVRGPELGLGHASLLRALPVPSPPEVSWIFSTPNRSFSSIWARLLEVEAPRRPQSQEHVIALLCTQAKGMPML